MSVPRITSFPESFNNTKNTFRRKISTLYGTSFTNFNLLGSTASTSKEQFTDRDNYKKIKVNGALSRNTQQGVERALEKITNNRSGSCLVLSNASDNSNSLCVIEKRKKNSLPHDSIVPFDGDQSKLLKRRSSQFIILNKEKIKNNESHSISNNKYLLSLRHELVEINKLINHQHIKRENGIEKAGKMGGGLIDRDILKAKKILAEKKLKMSTPERNEERQKAIEADLRMKKVLIMEERLKKLEIKDFTPNKDEELSSQSVDIGNLSQLSKDTDDDLRENKHFFPDKLGKVPKKKGYSSDLLIQKNPFVVGNNKYHIHTLVKYKMPFLPPGKKDHILNSDDEMISQDSINIDLSHFRSIESTRREVDENKNIQHYYFQGENYVRMPDLVCNPNHSNSDLSKINSSSIISKKNKFNTSFFGRRTILNPKMFHPNGETKLFENDKERNKESCIGNTSRQKANHNPHKLANQIGILSHYKSNKSYRAFSNPNYLKNLQFLKEQQYKHNLNDTYNRLKGIEDYMTTKIQRASDKINCLEYNRKK